MISKGLVVRKFKGFVAALALELGLRPSLTVPYFRVKRMLKSGIQERVSKQDPRYPFLQIEESAN